METLTSIENVIGTNGANTIIGDGGDNVLAGAGGDDLLFGGLGVDSFDGGEGNDTVDLSHTSTAATIDLTTGTVDFFTVGVVETLTSIENIIGTSGANTIIVDDVDNVLEGGGGDDIFDFKAASAGGQDTISDFTQGEDQVRFDGFGSTLDSFADLDTNGNNVLDDGDANVSIVSSNTVIDLGGASSGAVSGDVTVVGVTDLVSSDFLFA